MDRCEIPHDPRHLGVPSGVGPKRFLSLWYVRRKPCTYLLSGLVLSLNRRGGSDASPFGDGEWRSYFPMVLKDDGAGGRTQVST
jgi:hypothetical protein